LVPEIVKLEKEVKYANEINISEGKRDIGKQKTIFLIVALKPDH